MYPWKSSNGYAVPDAHAPKMQKKKNDAIEKKKDCQYHPVLNPLNRDAGDVGVHVSSMVNVRYMWSNVATYSDGRSCETGD